MNDVLFTADDVADALRECRNTAYERGVSAGRAEATRMLEFAVRLNGSGHSIVKALQDEPEDEANRDEIAVLAAIDALIEAKMHGAESGPLYRHIADMIDAGESLKGGLGDNLPDSDFDPEQLAAGVAVEMEHTDDEEEATEIAKDHLTEDADYYRKLANIEGEALSKAIINGKEKFGCLMANLPAEIGSQLLELGLLIPDEDLGEDGREKTPHVTIRHGFHDGVSATDVASIAETWEEPIRVRLDHPKCFYGKDNGKPYDVIVFSVSGDQLHYLHDALADLPHTDTHKTYQPHATVAYVKAGLGDKWLGRMQLPTDASGQELRSAIISEMVYADAYRNKSAIPIGNPVITKAFDESKHPRGDDGRFIGREAIHAAKSDPALAEKLREKTTDPDERKKLDAALAGEEDLGRTKAGLHRERVATAKQEKADRIAKVRELANDISTARRGGEPVSSKHYRELVDNLPHLTVKELRSIREKLAASFFGRRKREDLVTALVHQAKVRAEQMDFDAAHAEDDPLDFGMGMMDAGQRPSDRRGEDLNPWHKLDKQDAGNFGEAQHGGRMEQRNRVLNATDAPGKTAAGTPDTGSVLKVPDKMLDANALATENREGLTLDRQTKQQSPANALGQDKLSSLSGAPEGAKVEASPDEDGKGSMVYFDDPSGQRRYSGAVYVRDDGDGLKMKIESVDIRPDLQGKGTGREIAEKIIQNAKEMGVKEITAGARRGEGQNGYYSWARYGFDAPIPFDRVQPLPPSLEGAKTIQDLMKTDEGRKWWKENGTSVRMTFNPQEQPLESTPTDTAPPPDQPQGGMPTETAPEPVATEPAKPSPKTRKPRKKKNQ